MSNMSNDKGRAYEFAWMQTLYNALHIKRNTSIIRNSSYSANERAWNTLSASAQAEYMISAEAAVGTIIELEPRIIEPMDSLSLEFQQDGEGIKGDVRDIVIKRDAIKWEIGLSIKHNHEAVKHSRLSHRLDFGKEWYGMPCSTNYWSDIKPIFDRLTRDKKMSKKWSEMDDKSQNVYIPLLQAFMDEVNRAYALDDNLPKKIVEYLIGVQDYYKVISHDSKRLTIVRSFNIHGTLNEPGSTKMSAISVPVVDLPTEIVALKFKTNSDNTVELYMNNGWQLSFRIHNASTKVEPSLKFDVQFISMPISVLSIECKWR